MNTNWQTVVNNLRAQPVGQYLPRVYTSEQLKGWEKQRDILADSYSKTNNGVVEIPFSGGASTSLVLEKPLSRGTVLLNTADKYAEPIVDFQTHVNPTDSDIAVTVVKFYRRYMAAPSHQQLTPVENSPGTSVSTDQQIAEWAARNMGATTAHSCCTAAMGPRDLGGVLSSTLTVYGVTGLSVGDISLIPLIPATHTCATVYAISERVSLWK